MPTPTGDVTEIPPGGYYADPRDVFIPPATTREPFGFLEIFAAARAGQKNLPQGFKRESDILKWLAARGITATRPGAPVDGRGAPQKVPVRTSGSTARSGQLLDELARNFWERSGGRAAWERAAERARRAKTTWDAWRSGASLVREEDFRELQRQRGEAQRRDMGVTGCPPGTHPGPGLSCWSPTSVLPIPIPKIPAKEIIGGILARTSRSGPSLPGKQRGFMSPTLAPSPVRSPFSTAPGRGGLTRPGGGSPASSIPRPRPVPRPVPKPGTLTIPPRPILTRPDAELGDLVASPVPVSGSEAVVVTPGRFPTPTVAPIGTPTGTPGRAPAQAPARAPSRAPARVPGRTPFPGLPRAPFPGLPGFPGLPRLVPFLAPLRSPDLTRIQRPGVRSPTQTQTTPTTSSLAQSSPGRTGQECCACRDRSKERKRKRSKRECVKSVTRDTVTGKFTTR